MPCCLVLKQHSRDRIDYYLKMNITSLVNCLSSTAASTGSSFTSGGGGDMWALQMGHVSAHCGEQSETAPPMLLVYWCCRT